MKQLLIITLFIALFSTAYSQPLLPVVDKSPMDVCYFPVDYPALRVQGKPVEAVVARVLYSRPRKEGRPIFGDLVEYGKLWRLGANEATELEFYKPVTAGGKKIPKGRYTLYAIVDQKTWTLIINKETDIWGSFKYNPAKDVARVEVPVQTLPEPVESLAMTFEKVNGVINLIIAWEKVKVALPFTL